MKRHILAILMPVLLSTALYAFQASPSITTVDPDTGKAGDAVSAKGDNLDKSKVGEFYLTDDKKDTKIEMIEQTAKEIKFKVPQMKPGRYHLMVLTTDRSAMLEQPVIFTVQ